MYVSTSYQTNREAARAFRFRFTDLSTFVKATFSVPGRSWPDIYAAEALSLGRAEPRFASILQIHPYSDNNFVRGAR